MPRRSCEGPLPSLSTPPPPQKEKKGPVTPSPNNRLAEAPLGGKNPSSSPRHTQTHLPPPSNRSAQRLGHEDDDPEHERHHEDRAHHAGVGSTVDAGLVDVRVPAAAGDQPAVDRDGDEARDRQREEASQNSRSPAPAWIAPGTSNMIPLSTISITAMLTVSDARAMGTTTAARARRAATAGS